VRPIVDKQGVTPVRALLLLVLAPLLALPGAASFHLCLCVWLGCGSLGGLGEGAGIAGGDACCAEPVTAACEAPACSGCELGRTEGNPSSHGAKPCDRTPRSDSDGPVLLADCDACRDVFVEGLGPFEGSPAKVDLDLPDRWIAVQPEAERRLERVLHRRPVCRPPPRAVEIGRGLPLRI
jgi:hypothetical protein